MSYILDALKRADAERERGRVPGLHAHPLGEGGTDERAGRTPRWALWAGIAVGAVVLAALAWRMGADANAPLPVPQLVPSPAPAQPPAEPRPDPIAAPASPPPPTTAAETTPQPAPNEAATIVPSYAPPPAEVRASKDRQAAAAAVAPSPATAAAPARIPLVSELPAPLRKQLPPLAVGGSVYSDDAASRFIVLDGEVAKEGSQPAPGLVLERIEPRSAVLRYKGERFRLPF
jgi:general secretion pathway protein B